MLIDAHQFPYPALFQGIGLIVVCIVWVVITVFDGRP
jgi:hypothetical protein